MSMAGSSSSTNNPTEEYDVFLSFRGEDTRNGFTSHLYAALCRKKIHTFIDDQIVRGDEISSFLLNTIKASKISVIIFSKNYASSRWCLQELEQILHCKKTEEQIVIPVFYHVDPSDVRNQTGSFGDGFAELEKRTKEKLEMLQRWKTCLKDAASLAGWTLNDQKSESILIDETLDDILVILNKLSTSDYTDLVGIEYAIKTIESMLLKGSTDVSIIGIWGIGGVGKTTIARAVFDKNFSHFEGSYFVENVREESEKSSRLTHLQKKLLSTILEDRDPNIGCTFTRKRLEEKKVLIVFDDVTSSEQIENLIGNLNRLSSKNQIIITTRNKQVLRNCGVDDAYIYKVEGLREKEAHKLFNQYAFKQDFPIEDYMELSNKAITYTKGLPLALKVLGSYLFSRGKEFWESAINKLEKGPPSDIQKVLRVSYDGLEKEEKDLFLDIACFFKGEDKDRVIETLNHCDISAKQGIRVLIDKCLVSVTYNKITMHDLLREMGKEIARDGSCKHIRLWHHVDIWNAFKKNKGIEAVRGINLDISKISNAGLKCHVLSKMDNLRFFRVYNSEYQDNYENKLGGFEELESFPNDITFFDWNNYPFKSLPLSFPSESLVTLIMQDNKVKHWNGVQNLVNLKYVDLSFSKHMMEIPNLSSASNLHNLILEGCSSLLEITSSSIQNLNKLVELDLRDCIRLISLPDDIQSKSIELSGCCSLKIAPKISSKVENLKLTATGIKESPFIEHPSRLVELGLAKCSSLVSLSSSICNLKFLKLLNLEACSKLERLPDDFGDLEALEGLNSVGTVLKEVPSSILHLPKISKLFLNRHSYELAPLNWVLNSSSGSSSLVSLHLGNCQITKLPNNLLQLSFLKELHLNGNNFESIPGNIKELSNLYILDISKCRRLQLLPELPVGVNVVAFDCSSLKSILDPSFLLLPHWRSRTTIFTNCFKLDLPKILHEESCREFCASICFPGNEIPKWFTFQNMGSCITLDHSLDWHNKNFLGFLTSAVVSPKESNFLRNCYGTCYCLVKTEDGKEQIYRNHIGFCDDEFGPIYSDDILSDHVLFNFHSITKKAFEDCDGEYHEISSEMNSLNCKVLIKFHEEGTEVKKCGIHFMYVEDYGEPLETSKRSVDNATKKGKEKEKDELRSNKFQISNSFDGISSLRPRFMSNRPLDLECLEARYWKLKRNALREILKNALLNFQQNTILCSEVEEMNCENPKGCMSFPGSEILEWFTFQNSSYYIELPRHAFHSKFAGLAFCTVVEFPNLLDLGQTFFVNCEWQFKNYCGSYKCVAIGSIQGWFEGDRTHCIKSDHVFLGYDCVMYAHGASYLGWFSSSVKAIVNFYVTNYDGVLIEGCKVKKCGVRLLCPQDFENIWKNPIDLSSLKRRLKLNGNGRCNDEPPSYDFSVARDWQSRTSTTSLDLNEMDGSTAIDTVEPLSKRLKICNYKNKRCEDGKEVEELNPSTSQPTAYVIRDENEKEVEELNGSTSQPTGYVRRYEDEKEVEKLNSTTSQPTCYVRRYEDEKEVEELNPSTSQPIGFPLFELNDFHEDEPQPKRLFRLLLNFLCHRC